MRADITRPTAASGRSLMRVARAAMARKPSQSPVAETTWVSHRRKKACDPNSRTCTRGESAETVSMATVGMSPGSATPTTLENGHRPDADPPLGDC